jgi:tRNA nucleotidyltransferase (CCA-adding enzyme)
MYLTRSVYGQSAAWQASYERLYAALPPIGAAALVRLLERCDAFRRPDRFADTLLACECDARGRGGLEESAYPQRERLAQVLRLALAIDTSAVAANAAARGLKGPALGEAIHAARAAAVAAGPGLLKT